VQRHAISGPTYLFANNSRFKYWLLKLLSEPVRVFAFSDGIRIPWRGVSWLMGTLAHKVKDGACCLLAVHYK
jgi:hypothetical protein